MKLLDKYKHISFDLDGTLVHTAAQYRYQILPETVKKLGGKIPDKRAIDRFWFEHNRGEIIEREFGLKIDEFVRVFRKVNTPEKRVKHTWAYPDAAAALVKLKRQGKLISVITGSPIEIVEMEIAKLGNAPIDLLLPLSFSPFAHKPDPASFFHVLEKLQVKPEETLAVGNGDEDALFAREAELILFI